MEIKIISMDHLGNGIGKIDNKIIFVPKSVSLDQVDIEYLESLINKFNGGPVGVETIASSIGEEVSTLESTGLISFSL